MQFKKSCGAQWQNFRQLLFSLCCYFICRATISEGPIGSKLIKRIFLDFKKSPRLSIHCVIYANKGKRSAFPWVPMQEHIPLLMCVLSSPECFGCQYLYGSHTLAGCNSHLQVSAQGALISFYCLWTEMKILTLLVNGCICSCCFKLFSQKVINNLVFSQLSIFNFH